MDDVCKKKKLEKKCRSLTNNIHIAIGSDQFKKPKCMDVKKKEEKYVKK